MILGKEPLAYGKLTLSFLIRILFIRIPGIKKLAHSFSDFPTFFKYHDEFQDQPDYICGDDIIVLA